MTRPILTLLISALGACPQSPSEPTAPSAAEPAPETAETEPAETEPATAEPATAEPAPATAEPSQPVTEATLAAATNRFAFELYPHAAREPGNVAIAPGSITLALAMTWAGARGETAEQMAQVLHFGDADAIHGAAADTLRRWNGTGRRPYELAVASRLFGQRGVPFEQPFLTLTRSRYGAPLEPVDFGAAEAARAHINEWVEEQTHDRIEDLLPPASVDADTRLVLVNAVYFLGKWVHPFPHHRTREVPFFREGARSVTVPMMEQTTELSFAHIDGVKAVELAYRGDDFAMTLLLPDARDGLADLERRLDVELVDRLVGGLEPARVEVALPKFTIDPSRSLALKEALTRLGMPLAFDRAGADFRGITDPPNPADRVYIGQVYHQAFVKVDEEGTEAAAATAVAMPRGGRPQSTPEQFRADHPFLFLIRDLRSGMILFVGRVADPSAT